MEQVMSVPWSLAEVVIQCQYITCSDVLTVILLGLMATTGGKRTWGSIGFRYGRVSPCGPRAVGQMYNGYENLGTDLEELRKL